MRTITIILAVALLSSFAYAQDGISMSVMFRYGNGTVSVDSIDLVEGAFEKLNVPENEYEAVVTSLGGDRASQWFSFPKTIFIDVPEPDPKESYQIRLNESAQYIALPYYKNADKLKVYDADRKLVLEYDLSSYRVCDYNGMCSLGEDSLSCPEDCEGETASEDRKIVTPSESQAVSYSSLVFGVIVVLVLISVIVYLLRKKR